MRKLIFNKLTDIRSYYAIVLIAIILMSEKANAQQIVFSQYSFNKIAFNPGYSASHENFAASLSYRKQWDGFSGAPETMAFSTRKQFEARNINIGMWVSSEKIGVHKNNQVYGVYSYKIRTENGIISMGLQAGLINNNSDYSMLDLKDKDQVMTGSLSGLTANFGTGVYFYNKTTYIGVSIPQLIQNNTYSLSNGTNIYKQQRAYYMMAGKVVEVSDQIKVMPTALLRIQQRNALSYEAGINIIFEDVFTLGAGYRSGDAVNLVTKIALSDNLSMSYGYDINTSDIRKQGAGSHEMMLHFRIPSMIKCPAYF